MKQSNGITPGDRFVKADFPDKTWVIIRPLDVPDLPPHYHMVNERHKHQQLTMSASALRDPGLYKRVNVA